MRALFVSFAAVLFGVIPLSLDARQDAPRSPRNANYVLEARLDPSARTIRGKGRLNWRNSTTTPASELRFHLYWNAWRNADSTWMRGRQLEGDTGVVRRPALDPGLIDITAIRLITADGPLDLLSRLQFVAPDDGNALDRTLVLLPLDRPVPPAHDVAIEFEWTSKIPRPYDRTGVFGSDFFIAQWFPKVGVLKDEGWRAAQFHAPTEFFADFGTYDVSLTVPSGWILGATGQQMTRVDGSDGTSTHRYLAQDVHDFAWVTSPDFIDRRTRVELDGRPPVELRVLLRPEHAEQVDRHVTAATLALQHYGQRLGAFPWPNLTIVDPVTLINPGAQGGYTGGMEYPMFIAAGTDWFNRWADENVETNIVHEIGHQYFQSAAANDEVNDAWIDEGITTFLTGKIVEQAFPNRFVVIDRFFGGLVTWRHPDVPWTRLHQGYVMGAYRLTPGWDAPMTPTWQQVPRTWVNTIYVKTPLALDTLERIVGEDTMTRALATFYARGAFRHPTGDDFIAILNSTAGRDLSWFVDAALRKPGTFDYAVGDVTSIQTGNDPQRFESTVIVQRRADGLFPVEVRMTFDDGSTVLERWNDDAKTGWHAFRYERAARVSRVEVDPDRVLVLDVHRTNNSWTSRPQAIRAADKWTPRWMTWVQHLLMSYAFFV